MIYDTVDNLGAYSALNPGLFSKLNEVVKNLNADTVSGHIDIDGKDIFADVSEPSLRAPADALLEDHVKYADLHLILAGTERMGVAPTTDLKMTRDYQNDAELFECPEEKMNMIDLKAGTFIVLFPGEGHMPLLFSPHDNCKKVRKAVFKIDMRLFR